MEFIIPTDIGYQSFILLGLHANKDLILDHINCLLGNQENYDNLKAEWFNYGQINHVWGIYESEELQSIMITSRPDVDTSEKTAQDALALQFTEKQFNILDAYGLVQATGLPTVRNMLLYHSQESNITILINELAGQSEFGPQSSSGEINAQIFNIYNTPQLYYWLNGSTYMQNSKHLKAIANLQNAFLLSPEHYLDSMKIISRDIAADYVSALFRLWFLTGRTPKNFCINAGDGVLLDKVNQMKLITIREGFGPELDFNQFKIYLQTQITQSLGMYGGNYRTPRPNMDIHMTAFSEQNIKRGIELGIEELIEENHQERIKEMLKENLTAEEIHKKLMLN